MKILKERISPYAIILVAIAGADLISTAVILHIYGGGEANPLFNFILRHGGIGLFTFLKLAALLLSVLFIELTKFIRTPTIEWRAWPQWRILKIPKRGIAEVVSQAKIKKYFIASIACYIGIYVICFLWANFW